jgi:hypothetical protein
VDKLSRNDWILGGVALLLVIDLLFLSWFSISFGPFTATSTATGTPDGWAGVIAVLVLIVFIADLAMERFSPSTQVPALNNSRTDTRVVLAGIAALFLALKFLLQISHFSDLGFGFWAALVLTIALIYFALQMRRGGIRSAGTT